MSFFKNLFRGNQPEQSSTTRDLAHDSVSPEDQARLAEWLRMLRADYASDPSAPLGRLVARAGELALGTPYAFKRLDGYLKDAEHEAEPLTLSLTHFEAVTLIESCVALARCARLGTDTWEAFGREVERLRYRGGRRGGYPSRLHYFSEWISDNASRGNVRDLGQELGGVQDDRPLHFMTAHRSSYPALQSDVMFQTIKEYEERLDKTPRWMVPQQKVSEVSDQIDPGDILAFASGRKGLDVSHCGIAYRDDSGTLRVLQAFFSANRVEVTAEALPEYVASRRSTGIFVARPL